jgi:protein phosphatase 1G
MGTYLTVPIKTKENFSGESARFKFGGCHMQGWRSSQEDAAIHIPDLGDGNGLFAVMDGHGSNEIAEFARDTLPGLIKDCQEYKEKKYEEALINACKQIDAILKDPAQNSVIKKYTTDLSSSQELAEDNITGL